MYEFIIDMNPISSFTHINWNKLLLKFFKLWKMESRHPKCNTLLCFHLEVVESYNRVLKRKPMDALSMVIASNNLIAIKGGGRGESFLIHWRNLANYWRIRALGKSCSLQKDWTINFLQGKRRPLASIDVCCFCIQISLVKLESFWPYHYFIIIWSLCANLSHS